MRRAKFLSNAFAFSFSLAAIFCAANPARAQSLEESFPSGQGARFAFSSPVVRGELVLSIVASSAQRVTIECLFSGAGRDLWEQFTLDVSSGAPVVTDGYLLTSSSGDPERIPPDLLRGLDDVALADFLLRDRAQLERDQKGAEPVVVGALGATVGTTRYERNSAGRTLTYWLSEIARPLRLVKLESRGPKPQQNYSLTLTALLRRVGSKIDPARAMPMKPETRALLQAPLR